jgi:ribosomal protein S14
MFCLCRATRPICRKIRIAQKQQQKEKTNRPRADGRDHEQIRKAKLARDKFDEDAAVKK